MKAKWGDFCSPPNRNSLRFEAWGSKLLVGDILEIPLVITHFLSFVDPLA